MAAELSLTAGCDGLPQEHITAAAHVATADDHMTDHMTSDHMTQPSEMTENDPMGLPMQVQHNPG